MKSGSSPHSGSLCYFTCTLSEARDFNRQHNTSSVQTDHGLVTEHDTFKNINEFVDFLANGYGERFAVGCATRPRSATADGDHTDAELLNFGEVRRLSCLVAGWLKDRLGQPTPENGCVALLASSSSVFLLTWLGLIRAGFRVLLIAPQSSSDTARHLLNLSKSSAICFDARHANLARKSIHRDSVKGVDNPSPRLTDAQAGQGIREQELPWPDLKSLRRDVDELPQTEFQDKTSASVKLTDVAFFFHSSGTTGLPKLIPQTHHGAVGILPLLQQQHWCDDEMIASTFTTTPLYHGGIADLFRSWSAAAPLWIFTEGHVPITGNSVEECIRRIDHISQNVVRGAKSRLEYFSCVPFVLESATDNDRLKQRLRRLDMIGVGGAAMPKELGDMLVAEGFRLVSRFGSSECGFMLSSSRDFANDNGWDVLRATRTSPLKFTAFVQEQHELIVPESWPLVSTAAHARRPFNTHDVFVQHEQLNQSWRYIGRSDTQLTLRTGEKFDPISMENALRKSEYIEDALVLGEGKPFPVALLFVGSKAESMPALYSETQVWSHVQKVNAEVATHARLGKQAICLLPASRAALLPKNNKGGVMRSAASAKFHTDIAPLYGEVTERRQNITSEKRSSETVYADIETVVKEQLNAPNDLGPDEDLFEAGLNSAGALRIRNEIVKMMPESAHGRVPLNIAFESGSIRALTQYCRVRIEDDEQTSHGEDNQKIKHREMKQMVETYSESQPRLLKEALGQSRSTGRSSPAGSYVVLTGSTGFLGTHTLSTLLRDKTVQKIWVLVRGSGTELQEDFGQKARARVMAALSYHRLDEEAVKNDMSIRVSFAPLNLRNTRLGIAQDVYDEIVSEVTHVVHAAWEVNFNLPLKAFSSQIQGTVNLFNLAVVAKNRRETPHDIAFIFCSSIASIAGVSCQDLRRCGVSTNPQDAAQIGYAQSKWVAENVLQSIGTRDTGVVVSVARIGQLGGDSQTGVWNEREAWPLMLHASGFMLGQRYKSQSREETVCNGKTVWVVPDLSHIREPTIDWLPADIAARLLCKEAFVAQNVKQLKVFTIAHHGEGLTWEKFLMWMKGWLQRRGEKMDLVSPSDWLKRLETCPLSHRAKALVPLWRDNWQPREAEKPSETVERTVGGTPFAMDEGYTCRILDWVASLRQES